MMTAPVDEEAQTVTDERLFFRPPEEEEFGLPVDVGGGLEVAPEKAPGTLSLPKLPDRHAIGRHVRAALVREAALGTPFLFLPVGLLCGIVIYFSLPSEPALWNILSGLTVLVAIAFAARHGRSLLFASAVAGVVVLAGMALAQTHTMWMATPMLGSDVSTRLTGRILAIEERANGRTRFTIDVDATERPVLRYAPERVRVSAPGNAEGFEIGGGVYGLVRLTSPSGPAHPGGYDFAFHSFFDGIGANGFFLGRPAPVILPETRGPLARIGEGMAWLRQAIGREIVAAAPDRRGAVANALVTGRKSAIPEEVAEALRISGLAHILSISGLHMALVATTVMASLRFGFALFPEWSSRRPVRKFAAAGALAATGFYLFLAGAGVATQRSFVMLAIMLLALTFDRNAVTMRNLALAGLAIMLIAPNEVLGPGFQMSFAATLALIAAYGGWQDWRESEGRQRAGRRDAGAVRSVATASLRFILGIAVTSLVAGLATGLYASYHFGRVAPYGLLANLMAMPVVTILVMPLAVAAMVAMPFGLHFYVFKAMAWAVGLVIAIAEYVAGLSPPIASGQMPASALLALSGGMVLLCLLSSWLRWSALALFAVGATVWVKASAPIAVISEDARQFALVEQTRNGARLHHNRDRPNAFMTGQWQEAYRADTVLKPDQSDLMNCTKSTCSAVIGKIRIGYAAVPANEIDVTEFCASHDLVILAKAPAPSACPNGAPTLTARSLALNGAAEIRVSKTGGIKILHALPGPSRPWLDHRRYSRAARNLAERR